jgi:hypothetical protein
MTKFDTVEDYLEVIAGKRNLTNIVSPLAMFASFDPIISLARYDTSFLDSVTDATLMGTALTDRQAELSIKLINKYQRQLQAKNISLEGFDPPKFRKPLRMIDRSKSVYIKDQRIHMKFPYDTKAVEQIRSISKESQGKIVFNRDTKEWDIALTEYNLNWVAEFAKQSGFTVDAKILEFMERIIQCEQAGFAIQLIREGDGYCITNAPDSMIEYIANKCGGFGLDNRNRLVDMAPVLGYIVDTELALEVGSDIGGSASLLSMKREYDMHNAEDAVPRIVQYAKLTNRFPIVAFNPTPSDTLGEWLEYFDESEVLVVKNTKDRQLDITEQHKVIYTHRPLRHMDHIPLLVSHAGMMIGFDKGIMLGRADKIIYAGIKLKS